MRPTCAYTLSPLSPPHTHPRPLTPLAFVNAGIEDDGKVFAGLESQVLTIGSEGNAAGEFNYPAGVAIDGEGHIVVADSSNHRVQVLKQAE